MITLVKTIKSKIDSTQKFLFELGDKARVEFSYINKGDGKDIICVPSQTSCKMGCKFCFLTTHGKDLPCRNVSRDEILYCVKTIIGEVALVQPVLLVSYMGAGEPLRNVNNVLGSIRDLMKDPLVNSGRLIKFALCTMLPKGKRDVENSFIWLTSAVMLNEIPLKVHYSLHFTDDKTRAEYMPSAGDIKTGISLLETYHRVTGQPVEIHYALIDGKNDRLENADGLVRLLQGRDIPVKFLTYSKNPECAGDVSNQSDFMNIVMRVVGIKSEVYTPPGTDIGASCGQFNIDDLKANS